MPKWEATSQRKFSDILIPLGLTFGSLLFLGSAIFFVLNDPSLSAIFLLMLSLSVLIYFLGRIISEMRSNQDYIEILAEGVKYRSTPPFGSGWLAQKNFIPFEKIYQADLVQVSPFYNANQTNLAILLQTADEGNIIIGNNLDPEQLLKVGIALRGTVTLSNQLQRFLGIENVGETFKGFVDTAKNIWNQFKEEQRRR